MSDEAADASAPAEAAVIEVAHTTPVLAHFGLQSDQFTAATILIPGLGMPSPRVIALLFPGGGYTKEYFHRTFAGRSRYSMAEHLIRHGMAVVLCDHLGTGASSRPPAADQITPQDIADANALTVSSILHRIDTGEFAPYLTSSARLQRIGIGHSVGAGLLAIQQARHESFDALVAMGWSGIQAPTSTELAVLAGERVDAPHLTMSPRLSGYVRVERGPVQHRWYHWDDVSPELIAADDALAIDFPPCLGQLTARGAVADESAAIRVPILIVLGERDLSFAPEREAHAYPASRSVSTYRLARSGHCHNLARTRQLAWDEIVRWSRSLTPT